MLFSLFKRKRNSSNPSGFPGTVDLVPQNTVLAEAFAAGKVPCQQCKFEIPMKGLQQLRMVECPVCKAVTFVPLQVGRFWLFEPLGGGGMGSVYRAMNPETLDRHYAVKVLSRIEKTKPANIHALLNEARIGKLIGDHPCLVKCVDSGCENGEYFSAMELVVGERLDKRIDRLGRLPEPQVLQIALHILAAEQHIFKCGYLYRDLKPENIIINNEGYAILFDYGLCMPREDALHPKDEFVSGSPYYLPPERLLGKGEDACSEIYSLGMVIYYALSGQTYFDASEVEALAKRHVSKVRLSVSSKLRGFPEDLVAVLTKMIRQEPEERFQSFHEVARAIRAIQEKSSAS
jgi:serine/threonine-protein kinase